MDKTLAKGVRVLELLLNAQASCGVTELSRMAGLHPSNVHRTLQTWMHLGFVAQDADSGLYRCTLRLFEWGSRVAEGADLRQAAREPLERLARHTQETIHLSVLEGAEIVYLDKIDSPQPVRAYSAIGGRAPAHCVATGKTLLAAGGRPALDRLPLPLPQATRHTVADLDALARQLDQITRVGWAVNREEWRLGVSGLGAPIHDQRGQAIAAVGLSAPTARLDEDRIRQLGPALAVTALEITQALGGRLPLHGDWRSQPQTA